MTISKDRIAELRERLKICINDGEYNLDHEKVRDYIDLLAALDELERLRKELEARKEIMAEDFLAIDRWAKESHQQQAQAEQRYAELVETVSRRTDQNK